METRSDGGERRVLQGMALNEGTHGVVIVHGIGDQRRGDTVAEFSKALCDTLINPANGFKPPTVELVADVSGSPPSVTLDITAPDGKKAV